MSVSNRRRSMIAVLLALLLAALACNVPVEEEPPAAQPPVVTVATPVEGAPPQEEMTTEPGTLPEAEMPEEAPDVVYEGVSFSYDDSLASQVVPEIIPAEEGGEDMPPWEVAPQHIMFTFNGYPLPDAFHTPRIMVYPVAEFGALSEYATGEIERLEQLLIEKPAEIADTIPLMPIFNAAQMMHTQVRYLTFQNGDGVRFLSMYGQAIYPVDNKNLFYTFQGVTDDGAKYVAVFMPVSHPSLPADGAEIMNQDYESFEANWDSYLADIVSQLDAQSGDSFTPSLLLLDAMVESIQVE
jgi:hypothetical protein